MTTPARAEIAHLPEYSLPDLELPGRGKVVQLAQNELAIAPSPAALRAARTALDTMNLYPFAEAGLRETIAEVHGLNPAQVLTGAGSLELMSLLATAYCERGAEVVVSQYGYKFFQVLCTAAGATLRVVPEPGMQIDIGAIAAAVGEHTRLVFVVNPGNPTGTCLPAGAIRELRASISPRVMLIIDGAYAEFAEQQKGFEPGFDLVDDGKNLVVLRTFSKAYGLAGMRIGWAYAPPDVVATIQKIRPPTSTASPSLAAAAAAMRDRAHLRAVCTEIAELRDAFGEQARSLGLVPLPSATNFVLFECPGDLRLSAAELDARLRDNGIILRPMGSYDLPNHLRISIGSRADMALVSEVFTRLLG